MPVVTRIPGYADNEGVPKPVLVFGAGYDTNKDSSGLPTADGMGRGVFIVDAATGDLQPGRGHALANDLAAMALVLLGMAAAGVLLPFSDGASVQAEGRRMTLAGIARLRERMPWCRILVRTTLDEPLALVSLNASS